MTKGGGGKIRGFFFEIDGADETLQEGLRNFGSALGRALSNPVRAPKERPVLGSRTEQTSVVENDDPQAELEFADDFVAPPPAKPKRQATARKAAMPDVVDFDPKGNGTSLEAYAAAKNPSAIIDRILVAAAWLKEHGGVAEFSQDHIFTCFKLLAWTPHPANYSQAIFDLKRKNKNLDKGASPSLYKINLTGLNTVAKLGVKS